MLSPNDTRLLEDNRPQLIRNIDLESSLLLDELRSRRALTPEQAEFIETKPGNSKQVGQLLNTLLKGDVNTIDKFIYALRDSGHKAVVEVYLREPFRDDVWDPEELEKVQAQEREELQQKLRHNIEGYIRNDPSKILEEAKSADYINQPIVAHKIASRNSSEKISPENIFQLLESCHSEGQRIFIYGVGGMGKSSLCRHVAQTWVGGQSKLSEHFDYIFPIPMRAIRSHSLVDMICKDVELIPESWKQRIEQELELRSVLFILDSFEELSHETPEINKLIRRELFPKSSVLITARPGYKLEEEEKESAPCIKADLQELTEEQVKGYMATYPGLQEDVRLGMEKRFGMGFLRKPINVWLLCLLVEQTTMSVDMPNTQTSLLNRIIQRLMLAYCKKKKLPEFNLTSESPMKSAHSEVKLRLEKLGHLCYFGLRDIRRVLILDDGVLSKEEVLALGLFSEGADDNSVTLPHPLFQEYLAALFLSVDKRARQDLLKELREELESTSSKPSLVELVRPRGFENMVRFLVGLSPGVAEGLSKLFLIKQIRTIFPFWDAKYQHDLSYELDLLKECSVEEGRSMIAAALLKAPVSSVRDAYSLPTPHNNDSHLLLHYFDEEQQQVFLRKVYGCQISSHELIQAPDSGHFWWLGSFVVGMVYLHNCTVRLKKALFTDCNVPVSMLTDRLAAVEELELENSMLCDLTESQFLASLNLTSLSHSSTAMSPRQQEVLLSSVKLTRVKGLNLLSPPHCTLPTTRRLEVYDCGDINLGSLCQCFTGVSKLTLWKNKHVNTDNAGQWSSVRELDLKQCDRVDLICLKEMFVQLEELWVVCTALRVEKRDPDRHTQWHTVKDLKLEYSHLYTDERRLSEEEAREFLTHLCPRAKIVIYHYVDLRQ